MEKLKNYLLALPVSEREHLADKCGTTWPALRNISYGYRKPNAKLCVALEIETGGSVRRQDLLPDEWMYIWPELVNAKSQHSGRTHPATNSTPAD